MARQKSQIPTLRFHKSSGQWYVFAGGKRTYLGNDRDKATDRFKVILRNLDCPEDRGKPSSDLTIPEACLRYYDHAEVYYADKPNTISLIAAALEAVTETKDLPRLARDFRAKSLKKVRAYLLNKPIKVAAKPGKRRGIKPRAARERLSRTYINHIIKRIRHCWAWLASEEIVSAEASMSLHTVKSLRVGDGGRETIRVSPVDPATVARVMPYFNHVVAAMVELQQLTGMRPGEVCRLRRCEMAIDPTDRITMPGTDRQIGPIDVDGALIWMYVPSKHKNLSKGKPRAVPLGPQAQAILKPFLDRDPAAYLFSPREASDIGRKVIGRSTVYGKGREPKEKYTTASYGRSIAYSIERHNRHAAEAIPHWRPNQLRHALATEAGEKFDEATAAAMLGHSASARVLDTYMEQSLKKAAAAAAQIG